METNVIYCGDNLEIMREMESESVDLCYLDPPFFSQRDYGEFADKYESIDDYLEWLRPKLEECYRCLKPTGSLYVHLDWHAVHYVKMMMDEIFGYKNFKNEIVWGYSGRENPRQKMFARKHDTILFYVKSNKHTFNTQFKPYRKEYTEQFFKHDDHDGKGRYNSQPNGKGGRYKQYLNQSKGHPINDVWDDIRPLSNFGSQHERLGYPTQKPEALLERIIKASSNHGDTIFDPFCGCGTTLAAAQKLGRNYIGIDVSPVACKLAAERMARTSV